MVDAKRYLRLKNKGLAGITEEGGLRYLTFKRFSVEDGSEISAERQLIVLDDLKDRKALLEEELVGINALLVDLEK